MKYQYRQFTTVEIDECTSNILKVLFYIYLIITVAVAFVFSILVVGVLLARFIAVKCIVRSENYVRRDSFQKALGSIVL
jgi:hypothetical protein